MSLQDGLRPVGAFTAERERGRAAYCSWRDDYQRGADGVVAGLMSYTDRKMFAAFRAGADWQRSQGDGLVRDLAAGLSWTLQELAHWDEMTGFTPETKRQIEQLQHIIDTAEERA